MSTPEQILDLLLALGLLVSAALLLKSEQFLLAAVLFIAFGVLSALAWVRLRAPDVAIAEAVIGAGVTGVFLIDALRHMEWETSVRGGGSPGLPDASGGLARARRAALGLLAVVVGGLLLAGVAQLSERQPGLGAAVAAATEEPEHPVTAVLLVFRGLDTWLELGVLLLAVMGMLTVRGHHDLRASLLAPPRDEVLEGVVRVLVPLAVLIAGYFLWLGSFAAGGAFQAGVVLGAAGMLLWLSGHSSIDAFPRWLWQFLVALGFAAFTLAALLSAWLWQWALHYPESVKPGVILGLEVAGSISIGACFAALFVGQHPGEEREGAH